MIFEVLHAALACILSKCLLDAIFSENKLEVKKGAMQSQKEGEMLGEIRAKIVSQTIKEFTPLGAKLEINGEGAMTGPMFKARLLETISLFQKMDGSMEWEDKDILTTMEGDTLMASARGSGKATGLTTFRGEATGVLMTQSPKLQSLNGKKFRTEVTGDRATGEYQIKLWAV